MWLASATSAEDSVSSASLCPHAGEELKDALKPSERVFSKASNDPC